MVSFSFLNAIDPTTIVFIVLLALLVVALLVVPMFTNKKRARQTDELHRSLKPGDLIKTIGGIVGTIIEIRQISPVDKEMVIETGVGDNKTTMVVDIQALYMVMSRNSTIVPAKDEDASSETAEADAGADASVAPDDTVSPKVVPDILADRVSEPVVNDEAPAAPAPEPVPEKEEQPVENVEAEQTAVAEEPAVEPVAKPTKKGGNGKKSNGGAKKSGN